MSAHLTIALTIAFAVLFNAHIVVARSAHFSPAEMLKHMNGMEPEPVRIKTYIYIFFGEPIGEKN